MDHSFAKVPRLVEIVERLSRQSVADFYNPYTHFDWPDRIGDDELWMSRDLLSVHGSEIVNQLTEKHILALSKWESINFYSMNVHGIRELLIEVVSRIHRPNFVTPSEFFHHFVGEENDHMWFFAQFCLRYGGKIYPSLAVKTGGAMAESVDFLVFARILLFEEIVDYYNATMAKDEMLSPVIREINRLHHRDESRHIAFGRELVQALYEELREQIDESERASIDLYLRSTCAQCSTPSSVRSRCATPALTLPGCGLRCSPRMAAAPRRHRSYASRWRS